MLDLLLIRPCADFQRHTDYVKDLRVEKNIVRQVSPPLGVGYIIADTKRKGGTAEFLDMEIEEVTVAHLLKMITDKSPKNIGFTAVTIQLDAANYFAGLIKYNFPHIALTIGGACTTGLPTTEFPDFDLVWRGELFPADMPLDDQPFPDWSAFDLDKYGGADPHRTKRELPISTSRGCPFKCVFCVRPFGQVRRSRSIDSVIQEIKWDISKYQAEALVFCDETLTANISFSKQLFQRMIDEQLPVKWSGETRIDTATPELYKLMKQAGCYYLYFGFESGDNDVLKLAGKNFTVEQIKQSVQWAKEAWITCAGSFILGLPNETEKTAWKSIELAH